MVTMTSATPNGYLQLSILRVTTTNNNNELCMT